MLLAPCLIVCRGASSVQRGSEAREWRVRQRVYHAHGGSQRVLVLLSARFVCHASRSTTD